MSSNIFPIIQIGCCILIFVVCIVLDYIKSIIFIPIEKILNKNLIINKFNKFISNKINS